MLDRIICGGISIFGGFIFQDPKATENMLLACDEYFQEVYHEDSQEMAGEILTNKNLTEL